MKERKVKGINMATVEFKQDLVNVINMSGLPICVVQMALNEVQTQINQQLEQAIKAEQKAYEKGVDEDGKKIHKD